LAAVAWTATEIAPADWPATVTAAGLPPNAATLSLTFGGRLEVFEGGGYKFEDGKLVQDAKVAADVAVGQIAERAETVAVIVKMFDK
jgi:hypothetical protein